MAASDYGVLWYAKLWFVVRGHALVVVRTRSSRRTLSRGVRILGVFAKSVRRFLQKSDPMGVGGIFGGKAAWSRTIDPPEARQGSPGSRVQEQGRTNHQEVGETSAPRRS